MWLAVAFSVCQRRAFKWIACTARLRILSVISLVDGAAKMENSEESFADEREWQTGSYDRAREFEAERRKLVENYLCDKDKQSEEDLKIQRGWSVMRTLLNDVTTAAKNHALQTGVDVEDFDHLAGAGCSIVLDFQHALLKDPWDPDLKRRLNFWRHENDPLALVRAGKKPLFDRSSIESAASEYLKLPYQSERLERTLVDVLVAMELYAFLDEMLGHLPWFLRWMPTKSPLRQKHAVRQYIGALISSVVLYGGGAWLASNYAWNTTATVLVSLVLISLVLSTIHLPFAWRHQSKSRKFVRECIMAMSQTYSELGSDGVISARRIRESATKAADAGVVWPGPLFAILDDNIARTGRL
jgi:hypothetical protein